MSETIYVPGSSAKKRDTTFGEVIKLSFKAEQLGAFVREHKNEKGYINLEIVPRKSESQFGDTHSVKLDSWKPAEGGAAAKPAATSKPAQKPKPAPKADPLATDDIPF